MKHLNKLMCALTLLMVQVAHADANPAIAVGQMVRQMYSYSVHEFEFGRNPTTNRYDAVRNCALLRTFFDPSMLKEAHGAQKCEFDHSRFAPDFDGTPIEEVVTADGMNLPPPIPFIQSIKVNGDQAQVDILFGSAGAPKGKLPDTHQNSGRVVFFLKSLPQGWRIVNKLSFRKWPLNLVGENSDCRLASLDFQYALEPRTEFDLAYLPPACQKLMQPNLPK